MEKKEEEKWKCGMVSQAYEVKSRESGRDTARRK